MAKFKKATITVHDFKTASYSSNTDCYIARALKRAGMKNVRVAGHMYMYKFGGKRFTVYHTPRLWDAVSSTIAPFRTRAFTFRIPVA